MQQNGVRTSRQRGYMIVLTMIIVFVLTGTALTVAATISTNYASTKRNTYVDAAVSTAEAGVSDTIVRLKNDDTFTGYPDVNESRKIFYNNDSQGKAEYATVVTNQPGNLKKIVSKGYVYAVGSEIDGTKATNTKTIEVTVDTKQVPASYTTLVGAGGLKMGFNAQLPRGNVFVKGKVSLDTSSTIGSNSVPVTMNVGNHSCGTVNWPELCVGSEPISIGTFMSGGGAIYGSVCATGQTTSNRIFTGVGGTGLQPGCVAPQTEMPVFDKKTFVEKMTASSIAGNSFSCPFTGSITHTIPANTRITGDLIIGTGGHVGAGNCKIIFEGDTFIEGDINVGQHGVLQVADSLGSTRPIIVLNGQFRVSTSPEVFYPNASDTPAYVVSFNSGNTACSRSETVPSLTQRTCLTPTEAKDAADINGSVTSFKCGFLIGGGGGRNMTGVIFYSYYSTVICDIGGIQFRAVGGQGILIGFYGSITLGSIEESPFGQILTVPNYKVMSYRQVY